MTKIRNIRARHIQTGIRAQIKCDGAERVVIKRNGEVYAYGRMPNSIVTGWYFAGMDWDILDRIHRDVAAIDAAAAAAATR